MKPNYDNKAKKIYKTGVKSKRKILMTQNVVNIWNFGNLPKRSNWKYTKIWTFFYYCYLIYK